MCRGKIFNIIVVTSFILSVISLYCIVGIFGVDTIKVIKNVLKKSIKKENENVYCRYN